MDQMEDDLAEFYQSGGVFFKILSQMAKTMKDMEGKLNSIDGSNDKRFDHLEEMFGNLVYNIQGGPKPASKASKPAFTGKPASGDDGSTASNGAANVEESSVGSLQSKKTPPQKKTAPQDSSSATTPQTQDEKKPEKERVQEDRKTPAQQDDTQQPNRDSDSGQTTTTTTIEEKILTARPRAEIDQMDPARRALARKRWRSAISRIRLGVRTAVMSFAEYRAPPNLTIGNRIDMVEQRLDVLEENSREVDDLIERINELEEMIEDSMGVQPVRKSIRRSSIKVTSLVPDSDYAESIVQIASLARRQRNETEALKALKLLDDDLNEAFSQKKNEFKLSSLMPGGLAPLQAGITKTLKSRDKDPGSIRAALLSSLKLIGNTQALNAKVDGGEVLSEVCGIDDETSLDARLGDTKRVLMEALDAFADHGKMEASIYDMEEKTSEDNTRKLHKHIETRCGELIAQHALEHADDFAKQSEMNKVEHEMSEMGESVSELETLLKEQSRKGIENQEKAQMAIDEALKDLQNEVDHKASAEEIDDELLKVREQLDQLQKSSYPKETMERALATKIGKDDIEMLAKALKGGGANPSVDVGDPFFAVYKLNKPIKPHGMADIYAHPASYEHDEGPGTREFESTPEISFPPIPSPRQESFQRSASDDNFNEDEGDERQAISKYSRMAPRPVKIRTTVGGGIPGNIPREALKKRNNRR